jgi:pimeloyl-ACP methyl ester carboxylesterase
VDGLPVHHLVLPPTASTGIGRAPVLMLHGWGANLDLLRPLAARLATQGYPVYAPDLPGFGATPPPPVAWGVYDYADFALAYLDAAKIAGPAHLFGHSFGGRLGLILGANHAERFINMALADSAGVRSRPHPLTAARLRAYKAARASLRGAGLGGLADRLSAWYGARYGSSDFQAASGVMRETFVRVVGEDLLPLAAQVRLPTLLLWGDRDDDTPLWQAKLLEQTIPDAGLVVFEGAGHYSYLDRLGDTARILDTFYRPG